MHDGTKVLDVHGHVSVPGSANIYAATLLATNSLNHSPLLGGRGAGPSREQYQVAAAGHAAYLDERDIDVQVIGPRPFMMLGQVMPRYSMELWTEHVNATIAQQVELFPDRFVGACQLPQDCEAKDSTHMLSVLESSVRDLGFVATYVSPDPLGRRTTPGMNEPYWYPLYEKCVELDVPIIVHGTNTADARHYAVPNNYQIGFAMEQFLAQQILSSSDVFERYPALRVVICHCGGSLNRFLKSDGRHVSQKDLSANLFYDTCAHDPDYLTAAIRQRGIPQIVFGSEAPGAGDATRHAGEGPGKTADDLLPMIASFDWLTDEDRKWIVNTNPARVVPALAKFAEA